MPVQQPPARTSTYLFLPLLFLGLFVFASDIKAQDTVTGAFEGVVSDSQTGKALQGASVEITNQQTGVKFSLRTDYRGSFFQGLLLPGSTSLRFRCPVTRRRKFRSVSESPTRARWCRFQLRLIQHRLVRAAATSAPARVLTAEDTDIRATIGTTDGRRSGSFAEHEVVTLPIGGTTLTRTFDELALLLPGVAAPPQTLGGIAGPGVGAGVGSAGQFAVNGLRSRGNNFTVDGSDNNDEDIGVRRQGFVELVPQPLDSIQEYQVITALAPAQFGRNLGAQVNAVSKSGGNSVHGAFYGLFNSSHLNARNFFDTESVNPITPLRSAGNQPVLLDGRPIQIANEAGGKDSFTLGQGGFVFGGPPQIETALSISSPVKGRLSTQQQNRALLFPRSNNVEPSQPVRPRSFGIRLGRATPTAT